MKRIVILASVAAAMGVAACGCTPAQRSDCVVCNVTGLCTLLGDDPNAARAKHPAWFLFSPRPTRRPATGPASQPTNQSTNQPEGE